MKAFRYIMAFAALALLAISCDKGPDGYEVDSKSFTVEAFGPNPVTRGGTLLFVGQQLDKTTSVVLPEGVEIPSSQFIDWTDGSFKVTVPSECEEGYVTVNYSGGSVVLSTLLTYSETFELWSVAPMDASKTLLEAGDSVVVTGEYLNNVVSVGFVNGVTAGEDEIGLQERNELHFAVPKGAVSGLIYCEDANGYQVYSTEELSILQPTVSGVSPLTVRPGDSVTISGELLDQIVSVTFTGSSKIESDDFVSQSYTGVVVTVPYDAQDGPLTLVSAADQEFSTEESLTISTPSDLSVAAESVFKAGLNAIIRGNDLDLVTGVTFSGDAASESFYYSDGKLTAKIPSAATDGSIALTCGSGKTVWTEEITVVKPAITALDPTELTAGDSFTITGTDLDLVTAVALNGASVDFVTNSLTSITATTAATSSTGYVTLTAGNGDKVTSEDQITVNYDSRVIVTDLPSSASAGDEITMTGSNFNLIESIYFGQTKVTSYTSRSDSELVFTVPSDVDSGTYNPTFVLTDGDTEICPLSITFTGAVTIREVWSGSWDLGNWNALATQPDLCWNGPFVDDNIPYGSSLTVEFTCNPNNSDGANWYQLSLCDPDGWGNLSCDGAFYQCESDTETEHTWNLTDADVDVLNVRGFLISGCYCILTRIYVSYASE